MGKSFFIIAVLLFIPGVVWAAGIEVRPAKLNVELNASGGSYEFQVKNPSKQVQVFEVYADDFADIISITPQSFTLEAGGSRSVALAITPKGESRIMQTNLSMVANNLVGQNFQAQAGLKIPLVISFISAPQSTTDRQLIFLVYAGVSGLVAGLLSGAFLGYKFAKASAA